MNKKQSKIEDNKKDPTWIYWVIAILILLYFGYSINSLSGNYSYQDIYPERTNFELPL